MWNYGFEIAIDKFICILCSWVLCVCSAPPDELWFNNFNNDTHKSLAVPLFICSRRFWVSAIFDHIAKQYADHKIECIWIVKPFDRAWNDNSHSGDWNKYWGNCFGLVWILWLNNGIKRSIGKARIKRTFIYTSNRRISRRLFIQYLLFEMLMISGNVLLLVRVSSTTRNWSSINSCAYLFAVATANQMKTDTFYHTVRWCDFLLKPQIWKCSIFRLRKVFKGQ